MPCYEPPPPWHSAESTNAAQAVRLLCEQCRSKLDFGLPMNRPMLEWFIAHREIDLQIATTPYFGKVCEESAKHARMDIEGAKRRLAKLAP